MDDKNRGTISLAIETSCDETAIAVVSLKNNTPKILSSQVSSQVKLHAKWGGVVPNLAAREHVKNIDHMLKSALDESKVTQSNIDFISVTAGPGLIPALLVGVNYAKTLSYLWEKPLLGIHHIEGHIYANFISNADTKLRNKSESTNEIQNSKIENPESVLKFPALALVVSGGHTQLILMKNHFEYEIIGQTVDDAAGEAFDKVARILGIGYPGGPAVARHAANFQFPISNFQTSSNDQISNDKKDILFDEAKKLTPKKLIFPRPMLNRKNFDFSFSGLKTAVLYETKKNPELLKNKNYVSEICHEFQQACIDVLVAKTIKAAELHRPKTILLAGGVSANKELREQLGQAVSKNLSNVSYRVPELSLTGDNAAMIGTAACFRFEKMSETQRRAALSNWKKLQPDANLKMKK